MKTMKIQSTASSVALQRSYSWLGVFIRCLSVSACQDVLRLLRYLTRCMAEDRGGCGSISSWEGTWPLSWIWASISWNQRGRDGLTTHKFDFCTLMIIVNKPHAVQHLDCLGWLLPRRIRSWTHWELAPLLALAACSQILDQSTGEAGTTRTRSPMPGERERIRERENIRSLSPDLKVRQRKKRNKTSRFSIKKNKSLFFSPCG